MRIVPLALLPLLALGTVLSGCKGRTAAPLTEQDIALLSEAGGQDDDCTALIAEYRRTGNAGLATEEGTTMLHLACATGRESLMRHLLAAGADADACSDAYGYPLTALTERLSNNGDRVQFRRLADTLQQGGAHLYGNGIVLSPELDEDTYLYLLQRFPAGAEEEAAPTPGTPAAIMGWLRALTFYLEQAPHPLQGADRMLLHLVAQADAAHQEGAYLECAKLLMQHGLAADETAGEPDAPTPLLVAAAAAITPECGHEHEPGLAVITHLLRSGANPNRCTAAGECAYDYLVPLQEQLAAAGVPLPPPAPLEFTQGTDLLRTVLRADRRQESVEELRTAFGQIAQVLHPTAEMQAWQQAEETYATARLAAIRLLARADSLQAANAVAAMPAWADGSFFPAAGAEQATEELAELLQQLHELHLPLPAPLVLQLADKLCGLQHAPCAETAASAVELLAYGENTESLLAELRQDSRLPVQAAAWQATLLRKGLPTSKIGDMQGWMQERGLTAATPALQRLLRLTDWGKLLSPAEEKQILADLTCIGLPDAAARLRHLNTAESADDAPDKAEETTYLLEIATARYMAEHEADFRTAEAAAATQQEKTQIAD